MIYENVDVSNLTHFGTLYHSVVNLVLDAFPRYLRISARMPQICATRFTCRAGRADCSNNMQGVQSPPLNGALAGDRTGKIKVDRQNKIEPQPEN